MSRRSAAADRRPSPLVTRNGLLRAAALVAVMFVTPNVFNAHWIWNLLFFTVLYAAMSVAWNLIGGYAGYPSLGHAAFFGLGAYATAYLFNTTHVLHSGYEPFLMLPVIGVGIALIAVPIGIIAMRTRADIFAIVTITMLFVVQSLAYNVKFITGGAQGAGVAPAPFPLNQFELPFYFAACALLLLAMGISYAVSRTKMGLALNAIRGDEDKARGIGVQTLGVKLFAFAVSVALTAMAGGIWAYYVGFIYPQFAVDPLITIAIVLMTFLGGRGTLWGPVLGAAILMPSQQLLAFSIGGSRLYLIGYAAIFLAITRLLPRGIIPTVAHKLRVRRLAARPPGGAAGTVEGQPPVAGRESPASTQVSREGAPA